MSVQPQSATVHPAQTQPAPRLFDRRVVSSELRFALAETSAGGSKLVMLVGEPGSGKTQQAHDLLPFVRQRGGMLIESRIESLNWSKPLDSLLLGLSQLSQPLTRQLGNPGLSGQEAVLELSRRLGLIQQIDTDIDLSLALHLHLLVGELLVYASQQLKPLVWIIDDVDLLDQDALALLDYLIEHRSSPYLMFLLCVRDEHLPATQRWKALPHCQVFPLAPFSVRDTVAWLIEEQNLNPRLAAEIAPFLQQTCQGNLQLCRFLLDSLAAHNLLGVVPESQWQQRIQQISLQLRTPEAEAYFREQLLSLTETGLEILQSASLIGMEFDARLLHDYLSTSAVQEHLYLAQKQGLIEVLSGDIWRFVHPHLLRLAQHTFEQQTEADLHARLAQRMMKFPNFVLQALRHAQQAGQLMTPQDKIRFAHQSLDVAAQAVQQGSPMHAGQILEQLLALLGESVWSEQPQLSEQIVEIWCASWQEPAQLQDATVLLNNLSAAASPRLTAMLASTQLRLALLGHDYPLAFAAAELGLKSLGMKMSMSGSTPQLLSLLLQWAWWQYAAGKQKTDADPGIDSDDPVEQKADTDAARPNIEAAQQIFADLFGPCFFARPRLLAAITLKQLILSRQYGAGPMTAGAQICAAMMLNVFARYDAAFAVAEKANQMAKAQSSERQRHRVPILDLGLVQPWRQNLQQLLPDLWRWQQNAYSYGDFEFAGYAHMFYIGHSLLNGSPLPHLAKEAAKIDEDLRHTRQQHLLPMSAVFRQCLHNLVHAADAQPWLCEGGQFSADSLTELYRRRDALNLFNYYLLTAYMASFCHASEAASDALSQARPYLESIRGSVLEAQYRYLSALNLCLEPGRRGWWWRRQITRAIARLKGWAAQNPSMFASPLALLQAQFASARQQYDEAQHYFHAAIEAARVNQHHHEYGMAALHYGRFLLGRHHFHHARQMLKLAIEHYDLWGAAGISAQIRREFGAFLNKKAKS
ncbi:AAA family ATPase [Chitinibacter sp. FCG-7]|uniref:AAA family ATPase n=1 Tax=Chitinibacter mangrovi TaxID=3153927 RepID=A0AAU7FD04_9NEIS